jgi:predicted NAD/FAD-dependent oxidoreductase
MRDGTSFDHGAQYVTAREPGFKRAVSKAISRGTADYWDPIVRRADSSEPRGWIVGVPTMNALIKPRGEDFDVRLNNEVESIERDGAGWRVRTRPGPAGEHFDVVVSTAPAPQARALLGSLPDIVEQLDGVSIAPCWSLMVSFETSVVQTFDVDRSESDDLVWIARNSSKPGRGGPNECWVVHASPSWSLRHLELDRAEIERLMMDLFADALDSDLPRVRDVLAHRWRFAQTNVPLGKHFLMSEDRSLFVGGDWCLGARVEYAFESGQAIADAITAAWQDR